MHDQLVSRHHIVTERNESNTQALSTLQTKVRHNTIVDLRHFTTLEIPTLRTKRSRCGATTLITQNGFRSLPANATCPVSSIDIEASLNH